MLGAVMFVGDIALEWAMNIHPVTMLLMVCTVVYRGKGIVPFFLYAVLQVLFHPGIWIVPYLYIFPFCWLCTLAVPEGLFRRKRQICYTVICTLFGLAFGTLYAPFQAFVLLDGDFERTFAWVLSGLPADALHAAGNFAMSFLIIPLSDLIKKIR